MKLLNKTEVSAIEEKMAYIRNIFSSVEQTHGAELTEEYTRLFNELNDAYHTKVNFKLEVIKGGK